MSRGRGGMSLVIDARVYLWGRRIGAVSWDSSCTLGVFQYDPAFLSGGIEVAPLVMPVREAPYAFPALNRETFKGLPGLLPDALPDRFGNRLIDVWLAETGRRREDFSRVGRLCHVGKRAVGALEFEPALRGHGARGEIDFAQLIDLANRVPDERSQLPATLGTGSDDSELEKILSVGTSAGGNWRRFASEAGVEKRDAARIARKHRTSLT